MAVKGGFVLAATCFRPCIWAEGDREVGAVLAGEPAGVASAGMGFRPVVFS